MDKTNHELKCGCGARLMTLALPTAMDPAVVARRLKKGGRCKTCELKRRPKQNPGRVS